MSFRDHRSPRIAVLLVCGCALVSAGWFQVATWRSYARRVNERERFVAKYAALRSWLPVDEVVRFVVDEPHVDQRLSVVERYALAPYAVSPQRIAEKIASRWVIVDSDRPETAPEAALLGHWKLIADLHNGVRLYRTDIYRTGIKE